MISIINNDNTNYDDDNDGDDVKETGLLEQDP